MLVRLYHGADGFDGGIEPTGNLVIGGFERTRARRGSIEIGGQARAIGTECVQLIDESLFGAIRLAPPLGGRLEPIERQHQALGCSVDCASIGHCRHTSLIGPT
jgi:hypothetical protein